MSGVVDFGGGVRSIGQNVGKLQLVIFGDPRIGAAALSADRMAALDLPAKVTVYETEGGTAMACEVPADMLPGSDIPADTPVLQVMADTPDKITEAAADWRHVSHDRGCARSGTAPGSPGWCSGAVHAPEAKTWRQGGGGISDTTWQAG